MHPLAKVILPAAAVVLLALTGPAGAEEASTAAPASGNTMKVPVIDTREAVEDIDRWDTRNGFWIWPLGLAIAGGLIMAAYKLTPEPQDKITTGVVTTASGTTLEEPLS